MPNVLIGSLIQENARMKQALRGIGEHCHAAACGKAKVVTDGHGDEGDPHTHEAHAYLGSVYSLVCHGLDEYGGLVEYNTLVDARMSGEEVE